MSFHQRTVWRLLSGAFGVTFILIGTIHGALGADASLSNAAPEPPFDQERFSVEKPERNWSLIVGAGGIYEPENEGGDEFEVQAVPFIVFTYGEWLEIDPRGVTITPFRQDGFALSATVGYEGGRDEDDADRLDGLGDIDFAATVGAKVSYDWNGLELYAAVDQTIDGSESLIGTFGAEYQAPVTERLVLGASIEAVVANDKHMEAYFGVNAAQSARSGLPQYEAKAGLKRVNVAASATYLLDENWLIRGEAGVGVLTGDAADSPIVEEELQPSASLFVGYKF
ncbi:MipA/OmpV family protein [Sinorhizobium meliloti]|uniref:MipA/OmpV family protein n=1 Tax=Rhizobium meliloti TaxID=382 RepID=UPI000FD999FF|nr:MipA/OmpV family protein [Sinorhizobium meliloti]MDW9377926.1 MipA/OmpV family protein [Sinorhizobium meliloti]MDW9438618.1 MipA/OmpV family protein [Sinorhizobium meliloti]MDW9477976.1 MipA/OmpV family protein [Sinorhizobium meliloti]MDW9495837.1 MipA/OmpV family protein [Sinorhizobium meliloti]MDW9552870.1 MipA/OmpV family protein [Sinorhizobium meliloti]